MFVKTMRVGVVTSSRTFVQNLKKNLILIFAMSILYAVNSLAIGEIELIPGSGGGDLRPFIFIPALASIIFGPIVGSFSAGIGNFLFDFVHDRLIEGETLDLSNFAGLVGNFLGAAVVGFLCWRLKFDKDDKVLFSGKIWLRYLQNTLAAILGMGLVTGETIGLLRIAFGKSTWVVGNNIAANIFYSNSLFLIITIIPLQLVVGFYEKIRARRYAKSLHDSKNVTLVEEPDNSPCLIENFELIPGAGIDGLVKGEWSQIKMVLRNNTSIPMTFRLEINCEDRINPSVDYTKLLQPQEKDEKFFQINPFNDSDRVFTVYIKNWSPTFKELTEVSQIGTSVRYRYTYNALTPFDHHFSFFMKFLSLCSFGVFVFNTVITIYKDSGISFFDQLSFFISAIVICGVELIVLLVWYIIKLVRVKKKIARIKEKAVEDQIIAKEKREKEQLYYQQELMKIKDDYDLEIDETAQLSQEPIIHEEVTEEPKEIEEEAVIPTEIKEEAIEEPIVDDLPDIPSPIHEESDPATDTEETTDHFVTSEGYISLLDDEGPSQDEEISDDTTEQVEEEEEETWESMYDYNEQEEEEDIE